MGSPARDGRTSVARYNAEHFEGSAALEGHINS